MECGEKEPDDDVCPGVALLVLTDTPSKRIHKLELDYLGADLRGFKTESYAAAAVRGIGYAGTVRTRI